MSRSGITYDEVKTVAEGLSARGEKPTISRVKEELGGRGSTVAISAHLKQWRGGDELDEKKTPSFFTEEVKPIVPAYQPPVERIQVVEEERRPLSMPVMPREERAREERERPQEHSHAAPAAEPAVPRVEQGERPHANNNNNPDQPPRERKQHFDRHSRPNRNGEQQQRPPFRGGDRERGPRNNNNQNGGGHHQQHQASAPSFQEDKESASEKPMPFNYWSQYDYVFHGDMSVKSDRELETIIRRMESLLSKEQSRRETAEKLFEETKEYASAIKKQIADRINELTLAHDAVVTELKSQAREIKLSSERDLMFYRDQLGRANQKIIELIKGSPEPLMPEPKEDPHQGSSEF